MFNITDTQSEYFGIFYIWACQKFIKYWSRLYSIFLVEYVWLQYDLNSRYIA